MPVLTDKSVSQTLVVIIVCILSKLRCNYNHNLCIASYRSRHSAPHSPAHLIVGCGDIKELIARPSVCAIMYPRYCFAVRVLFWAQRLTSLEVGLFCFLTYVALGGVCVADHNWVLCAFESKLPRPPTPILASQAPPTALCQA